MIGKSQLADKYGIQHLETWSKTIAPIKHLLRNGKKTYPTIRSVRKAALRM